MRSSCLGKKHPKSTKIIVLEFSLGENMKEMVWYMDGGGKMCGQYCVVWGDGMEVSYGGTKIASSALLSRGYATPDEWCVNLVLSTGCRMPPGISHLWNLWTENHYHLILFKLESAIEIWFCEAYPEGFLTVNPLIIVNWVFLAMSAIVI